MTVSDENWLTDTFDGANEPNAIAVEFRDNRDWRRYGLRFNGGEEQKATAIAAILDWAKSLGYELEGPK